MFISAFKQAWTSFQQFFSGYQENSGRLPFWRRALHFSAVRDISWQPDTQMWEVLGQAPVMALEGKGPLPGWNMIELDVEGDIHHGVVSFEMETRRKSIRVDLPLTPGKITKRMVFVPLGVKTLSLVLTNAHGYFSITRCHWVLLTPCFANDRLGRRLSSVHPDYRDMSARQVVRALHVASVAQSRSWRTVALEEYNRTFLRSSARHNYAHWVNLIEPKRRFSARLELPFQSRGPTFSILMTLTPGHSSTDVDVDVFQQLVVSYQSLLAQQYENWEFSIVVAPSIEKKLVTQLRQHLLKDPRVKVLIGASDHIERLSHQGFIEARGDGVMWLSQGDQLAEDAFYRVADAWQKFPDAQLFYADEDIIDHDLKRSNPVFKPGWNPDLLMSANYVGRLAMFKRQLLWRLEVYQDIGRRNQGQLNESDLDYMRMLRVLAWWYQRKPAQRHLAVCHLPWVLYHRSRPAQISSFSEALVSSLLEEVSPDSGAQVLPGLLSGDVRIVWPIESQPLVSLLVPTRDGVEILKPCVDAILERTDYTRFELLILDNQSSCPDTLAYMAQVQKKDPRVKVLSWNHKFNYSAINNFGASHAKGEIIGLINNDIEPINDGWLSEMVGQVLRPDIGCVGAKLYYPNGIIQHGGVILGLGGVAGHAHRFFSRHENGYCGRLKRVQNLSAVTAACLLLRRDVFFAVGQLNEQDLAVAYNDVDLCLKVREAGFRNLWTPYAELYHHESISRGADDTPLKRARWLSEMAYMKKAWGRQLNHDPAYNPNLTLVYEDFSLR